jgi:hypothetical protein
MDAQGDLRNLNLICFRYFLGKLPKNIELELKKRLKEDEIYLV